ncbi:hypothetical protein V8C86DRAFT_2552101 [Haematococcus lacustris]
MCPRSDLLLLLPGSRGTVAAVDRLGGGWGGGPHHAAAAAPPGPEPPACHHLAGCRAHRCPHRGELLLGRGGGSQEAGLQQGRTYPGQGVPRSRNPPQAARSPPPAGQVLRLGRGVGGVAWEGEGGGAAAAAAGGRGGCGGEGARGEAGAVVHHHKPTILTVHPLSPPP